MLEGINDSGEIEESMRNMVMEELRQRFRPEFLNRLDEIILFKPLLKSDIGSILDLLILELNSRISDKEISVSL